jgi:hypothetical protein
MNNLQKRYLMFLVGCIGTRIFIAYYAKNLTTEQLPLAGAFAFLFALGWANIYLNQSRKVGIETFGDEIWWDKVRPIHITLYFLFALMALNRMHSAWIVLVVDVILGTVFFLNHHFLHVFNLSY